jgi:hypothetical protein
MLFIYVEMSFIVLLNVLKMCMRGEERHPGLGF